MLTINKLPINQLLALWTLASCCTAAWRRTSYAHWLHIYNGIAVEHLTKDQCSYRLQHSGAWQAHNEKMYTLEGLHVRYFVTSEETNSNCLTNGKLLEDRFNCTTITRRRPFLRLWLWHNGSQCNTDSPLQVTMSPQGLNSTTAFSEHSIHSTDGAITICRARISTCRYNQNGDSNSEHSKS